MTELEELRAFKKRAMKINEALTKLAATPDLHADTNSRAAWRTGIFDCKVVIKKILEGETDA